MEQSPVAKKSVFFSGSFILLAIIILLSAVFGTIVLVKTNSIVNITEEIDYNQKQISSLVPSELRELEQSLQARDRIRRDAIVWNPIVAELFGSLPTDVFLTSCVANSNGKITAQLATTSMKGVTDTIDVLSHSEILKNTFVPSVSVGASSGNNKVITFPLMTELKKK